MLDISLVIAVRNGGRTLPDCLNAVGRLDPAPSEIIFVDNGSSDNSLSLLQEFEQGHPSQQVKILCESKRGASSARNTGILAAKGEVVAFTDADCAPAPDWLLRLTTPIADSTVGAAAGRILSPPAASTIELFSALYTLRLPDRPEHHRHWTPWEGGFPTANLAVRRSLLNNLGGFDEQITIYGEDHDLCARLYREGTVIAYTPEATVLHYHRTGVGSMLRQAFGFGRSHPYLLNRHTTRGLWLNIPRRSIVLPWCPVPAWIDLVSADKKLLGILLVGFFFRPALWLALMYGLWLMRLTSRRGKAFGTQVPIRTAAALALLLLGKSMALTMGRWWGSLKYRTLCF